jgi:CRISPR/Cas system-associated exonuclease Cas4 (RecB family)
MAMPDLDALLPESFWDAHRLNSLLAKEKKRRKLAKSDLVFVGMHNVSQFWWCGMYAVLKSRANELEFFAAYLGDRIAYSLVLGRILSIPKKQDELLKVADSLCFREVSMLLTEPEQVKKCISHVKARVEVLSQSEKVDQFEGGLEAEAKLAEDHPTFRWHFPHLELVLVGCPDGVTQDTVYEFKATSKQHFIGFTKPVALTQADLYGHFFGRKRKRVQIYVRDAEHIETFDLPVDSSRVMETLAKFVRTTKGELPRPPVKLKCVRCEYREGCAICQC